MRSQIVYSALVFVAIVIGSFQAGAQGVETPSQREAKKPHELLFELYDRNEHAIAYYRHCISNRQFPADKFMDNVNLVMLELQKELEKLYPDRTPEAIQAAILERGNFLQRQNTQKAYEQGCFGLWAKEGKEQYQMVLGMEKSVLQGFIKNRMGR